MDMVPTTTGLDAACQQEQQSPEEAEEECLVVALYATECVEAFGISVDRYPNMKREKMKAKRAANERAMKVAKYLNNCRRRAGGIWNEDAQLCLWNNLATLIRHFEKNLWMLVPLHPSVLHEDSVRFALMGQPSDRIEDFPLLFNVNVAMACGTTTHHHHQNTTQTNNTQTHTTFTLRDQMRNTLRTDTIEMYMCTHKPHTHTQMVTTIISMPFAFAICSLTHGTQLARSLSLSLLHTPTPHPPTPTPTPTRSLARNHMIRSYVCCVLCVGSF